MITPNLIVEKRLWRNGYKRIVGIDEVGRGSLVGPVVAAAVLIDFRFRISDFRFLKKIKDSKKLTPKNREGFYKLIEKNPMIEWGIGRVSAGVIDKINILEATKLAMKRALKNLNCKLPNVNWKIDYLILDGKMKIDVPILQKSIVKADEKVFSCTIASIIAKVTRDKMMMKYHKVYPGYCFNCHKGYLTKYHLKMLKKQGPCVIHRKSFSPLKNLLK